MDKDPRVRFAAERTLLAWIRTGIALMGFGFVVARFGLFLRAVVGSREAGPSHGFSLVLGTAFVMLGVVVIVAAGGQHWRILQRLNNQESFVVPRWPLGLIVAGLLTILGITMAVYLLVVG